MKHEAAPATAISDPQAVQALRSPVRIWSIARPVSHGIATRRAQGQGGEHGRQHHRGAVGPEEAEQSAERGQQPSSVVAQETNCAGSGSGYGRAMLAARWRPSSSASATPACTSSSCAAVAARRSRCAGSACAIPTGPSTAHARAALPALRGADTSGFALSSAAYVWDYERPIPPGGGRSAARSARSPQPRPGLPPRPHASPAMWRGHRLRSSATPAARCRPRPAACRRPRSGSRRAARPPSPGPPWTATRADARPGQRGPAAPAGDDRRRARHDRAVRAGRRRPAGLRRARPGAGRRGRRGDHVDHRVRWRRRPARAPRAAIAPAVAQATATDGVPDADVLAGPRLSSTPACRSAAARRPPAYVTDVRSTSQPLRKGRGRRCGRRQVDRHAEPHRDRQGPLDLRRPGGWRPRRASWSARRGRAPRG